MIEKFRRLNQAPPNLTFNPPFIMDIPLSNLNPVLLMLSTSTHTVTSSRGIGYGGFPSCLQVSQVVSLPQPHLEGGFNNTILDQGRVYCRIAS
jgi:hypothetical protein